MNVKYILLLKPDSQKFLIAMAKAESTPIELAAKAGISVNFVYSICRGKHTKPKYLGACCRILNVKVEDTVNNCFPDVWICFNSVFQRLYT